MHLWSGFYVHRPMFAEAQLDGLQSVINRVLPQWSSQLRVAEDEDSNNRIAVNRQGRLYDCIHQVAAPKRGLGASVLTGAHEGLSFFLSHCDETLPPELNEMAIEICGPSAVEGRTVSEWAREAFEAIVRRLPVRYGHARIRDEFATKNLIDDKTGVEAIGVNLEESLPGLYWLNFFGRPYLDLMGRERLLSAPAYEVKPVDDGVLIALDSSAENWQSAAYREREQAVIAHLGEKYFFSRLDPARQTVAPNFRS